jgi:hypothetical protein
MNLRVGRAWGETADVQKGRAPLDSRIHNAGDGWKEVWVRTWQTWNTSLNFIF